jgi:citrate lyase beta subunit
MERAYRVRRSCLAVPASSERFIEKARGLPADEVFLDLEDSVAPSAKAQARANAAAVQAIDGPYLRVRDVDGLRRSAASTAALGFDGKWALHPSQVEAINQAFAPSEADYSRAVRIIEAYAHATTAQARGAVMLGDEMIDEASRKKNTPIGERLDQSVRDRQ